MDGYPGTADLPKYRGPFHCEALGTFGGPFGSGIKNAPIPQFQFPARLQPLFNIEFRQSLAEIEELSKAPKMLGRWWPADAIAYTNSLIQRGELDLYEGMFLQQAQTPISPPLLRSVVDAVRTRILDLALSFERDAPEAGESNSPPPDPGIVKNIITNVFGGSPNVAIDSADVRQVVVHRGDLNSLTRALAKLEIDAADIDDLRVVLEENPPPDAGEAAPAELPAQVQTWLGKIATKAAVAAGTGAVSATAGLAAKALAAHYGLG